MFVKLLCVVDHVALQAGDAPKPLIESKLLMAAQQFYNESRCLVRECDGIRLFANVRHYEVDSGVSGFGIAGIERLSLGGDLIPVSEVMIDDNWAWGERRGTPSHFLRQGERGIEVYPIPDAESLEGESMLSVRASLYPVSLDAEIDGRDIEALTAGALSRLLVMVGVSWSNLPLSDFYRREFSDAIAMKSNVAFKGDLNVPVSVQFRPLA